MQSQGHGVRAFLITAGDVTGYFIHLTKDGITVPDSYRFVPHPLRLNIAELSEVCLDLLRSDAAALARFNCLFDDGAVCEPIGALLPLLEDTSKVDWKIYHPKVPFDLRHLLLLMTDATTGIAVTCLFLLTNMCCASQENPPVVSRSMT